MIKCPKCQRELSDGTKFCGSCGAQVFETIFCPNCGTQSSTEFAFCQNCGASISEIHAEGQDETVSTEKELRKKSIMLGGIGVAVVLLILVIFMFSDGGGRKNDSTELSDTNIEAMSVDECVILADAYLKDDDVLSALSILLEKLSCEKSYVLEEKINYIKDHAIPVSVRSKDGKFERVYEYENEKDDRGNIIQVIVKNEDEDGNVWRIYKSDATGDLIKSYETMRFYESDGSSSLFEETYFDFQGNMIKRVEYDGGIINGWKTYEYDTNGNRTSSVEYDMNGAIISSDSTEYDQHGNQTKYVQYSDDGDVHIYDETDYVYDDSGFVVREIHYNINGRITDWFEFESNQDGNVTKATQFSGYAGDYSSKDVYQAIEIFYDANGNIIKSVSSGVNGEQLLEHYEYEYDMLGNIKKKVNYDQNDNLVSVIEYNSNGDMIQCSYYDKSGNVSSSANYDACGKSGIYKYHYLYND